MSYSLTEELGLLFCTAIILMLLGGLAMSIHPGLLGKYELQERLGRGGMAEVWKAFDQRLQRYVAIKFLHANLKSDPTFITRFEREARAVASLRHPNIVRIYDFETSIPGIENSQAYMVMDYIEGITLADYLRTTSHVQNFPSAEELVSLLFSISEAIDYAHQRGILHRDIKPANILLDKHRTERNPMGEPILSDFGIVKLLGTADGTLTSTTIGTPLYISPEQAMGKNTSAASDIYSLGVILYELCTGTLPFQGDSSFAILHQHIMALPPPPERANPAIPPDLAAVITYGLTKDPVARFPSAMALTSAVAEALGLPLPERQRLPISSPDIRMLPTSSPDIRMLPASSPDIGMPPVSSPDIRMLPVSSDQYSEPPTQLLADPQAAPVKVARPVSHGPMTPSPGATSTPPEFASTRLIAPASYAGHPLVGYPNPPALPEALVRPVAPARKRRGLLIGLLACLSIILIGGTFLYLNHNSPSAATIVGNAFFTSSGAAPGMDNLGLNDTFQVQLTNIPQPATGKQYYAWLMPDLSQTEANPRSLGTLTIHGGVATLSTTYADPQHTNLIAQFSRFLVTEEEANMPPVGPTPDKTLWRYYAVLPQSSSASNCPGTINQLSALCHLRHLLSGDPEIELVHLQGGLNYWFLNNVEEVQKWAREGVDHTNPVDVRHKVVDILYVLDGSGCIAQDVQQHGNPSTDNTQDDGSLPSIAAIPLQDCPLTPNIASYLAHILNHLNALIQAPGVQNDQVTLANQIAAELNMLNGQLTALQNDARQSIEMDNTQLTQAQGLNLRNQMYTLATNALSGGTDPGTGRLEKGANNISEQIQQLATMDVTPYIGH